MAEKPASIAAQNLKQRFQRATVESTIGSDVFDDLARLSSRIIKELDGPLQIVAYVLMAFFKSAAYEFSERAVSASEMTKFLAACHQPVMAAINFLSDENADSDEMIRICTPIIKAHEVHIRLPGI